MNFRRLKVLCALLCVLCLADVAVWAQSNQGQMAGNVTDPSGATIAGATLTAKNDATGNTYTATSSGAGSYRFPSMEIGRYTLTIAAPGFRKSVNTGIEVQVQNVTAFDVHLGVGSSTESVTVNADAPTIQTQSSDVSGTVNSKQIIELPLALGGVGAMRSPEAFVFLIPGTAGPGSAGSNNGIFISKIGGGQNFANEVLLDGASQTRSENGSSFDEEAPSVEAISEFTVTTSTPSAQYGRTTGGIENFVTKSGTNQYHGTAFEIFQNEVLNANDWFAAGRKALCAPGDNFCRSNNERPTDKKNDYGGSIGGPLSIPHLYNAKDKTFGFFSWEQFKQSTSTALVSNVPTVAEHSGDFSDRLIGGPVLNNGTPVINPCDGSVIQNGQIFDPATSRAVTLPNGNVIRCRTAFPGNIIPTGRFSAVGQNIAKFYPLPTNGNLNSNYVANLPYPIANTTYTFRIDQNVSDKAKIWTTVTGRDNTRRTNPRRFPDPVDSNGSQFQQFTTHFIRVGFDYIFSPNVLNHAVVGFNRTNSQNHTAGALGKINYAQQLGLGNNLFSTNFPRIITSGFNDLSQNSAGDNVDNGIRFADAVSWQKGRNAFTFGFDYRYQQYSPLDFGVQAGEFTFNVNQTKASDNSPYQNGTGIGFASLLLGTSDHADAVFRTHQPRWISNYWAGFVQDDLKISNKLTLNLGIRYDVDQPRKESHDLTSNFSLTAIDPRNGRPGALVFGPTCHCNTRWADTWYKDIAPRLGFAYNPSPRTVFRGGYAILYGPLQYNDFGGGTQQGFAVNPQVNSDGFTPAYQIDSGFPSYARTPNTDAGQFDNGNAAAPAAVTNNYIAAKYGRPALVNQWNFQMQQELAKDLIFTLGYIGQAAQNLRSGIENINNMPKSQFFRGDQLTQFNLGAAGVASPYAGFNGQVQQALRPFPQYSFIATDCCLQNVGHSSYSALVASLERRFSNGLNLQASYTWSKDLTDADSALPGINGGIPQEQDPTDHRSSKSISIQDIPNTFVVSYIYELPFGKDKTFLSQGRLLNEIVGGWQVGGVQRYQSGEPVGFAGATGIPGWDNQISFTRIPGSRIRSNLKHPNFHYLDTPAGANSPGPDPTIDSLFNGLRRPDNAAYAALQPNPAFYDQNASTFRGTGAYSFGNVPRITGEFRNYHYDNEDFSIIKNFTLVERLGFQLKTELLNAFNRHTFNAPSDVTQNFNNPNLNSFGVPRSVINSPRVVQFTGRFTF